MINYRYGKLNVNILGIELHVLINPDYIEGFETVEGRQFKINIVAN